MRSDTFILLATQKNASDDDPATGSIFEIGTLASVLQLLKLPDGTVKVLVEALRAPRSSATPTARNTTRPTPSCWRMPAASRSRPKRWRARSSTSSRIMKLNKKVSPEVVGVVQQIEDYAKLADTVASHLAVKIPDKQVILETPSVTERLEKVLGLMESEISVLQVEKRIRTRVKRQNGEDPARVLPQRADEGDPEGARRRGRQGRARRDRGQDQEDQALEGGARKGHPRAQEAAPDVADVGRGDGGAQLSRLAAVDRPEQEEQGQEGPRACPGDPGRRSLRLER